MLTGVISLLGRGTIAQSVVAKLISFAFFALHVHVQPYRARTLNIVKAVSEIHLFVVLLVCVVLQVHHHVKQSGDEFENPVGDDEEKAAESFDTEN